MRSTSLTIVGLAILAVASSAVGLLVATAIATAPDTLPGPRIIGLSVHGETNSTGSTVYRLWNDGQIEYNRRECSGCQWLGWFSVLGD